MDKLNEGQLDSENMYCNTENSLYGVKNYFENYNWSKVYLDYSNFKEYFFYDKGEKIKQCESCFTKWIEPTDSSEFYFKVLTKIDSL